MKTYAAKPKDITRNWYLVDASDASLGRIASVVARHLMGKQKPLFSPHIDCGDGVIVINAAKLKLSGTKLTNKLYYRHSGYPGNLKTASAGEILTRDPAQLISRAVKGMLPANKLRPEWLKRLKIYGGESHEHEAQKPTKLEVKHAR